jgi:acetylornithine deacetylase/succinyl-diaminopimelate desuccinylase-like protein
VAEREEIHDLIERLGGEPELWKSLPGLGGGRVERLTNELQEDLEEAFVRSIYGPESFNIQGINCGFLGPNTGTHPFRLPHEGNATFDVRLPRGYDPDITLRQIRDHLDSHGYEDVELDVRATHPWCRTDRHADIVEVVEDVLGHYGADVTYWPYSSGGVPWAAFNSRYDMPVLHRVGVGHQGTADPEEFLVIDGDETVAGLADCEMSYVKILQEFANR